MSQDLERGPLDDAEYGLIHRFDSVADVSFAENDFGIRVCCREIVREEHVRSVENGLEEAQMSELRPRQNPSSAFSPPGAYRSPRQKCPSFRLL